MICPNCGEENSERAKFCQACATPLEAPKASREERRVVSVLFVDLVGFTSKSEQLDPEDVRAMLTRYYERARAEIERYGGTVEKFIGDAVMAVFGAPIAYGDDPERAVRAALAVRDSIADMDSADPLLELQVRAAVNTGEAIVELDARPETGVAMVAGDVVNTAARLQSNAPVNQVHRRRRDVCLDPDRHPVRAGRADRRQGEVGTGRRVDGRRAPGGGGGAGVLRGAARRARRGARGPSRHVGHGRVGASLFARHGVRARRESASRASRTSWRTA